MARGSSGFARALALIAFTSLVCGAWSAPAAPVARLEGGDPRRLLRGGDGGAEQATGARPLQEQKEQKQQPQQQMLQKQKQKQQQQTQTQKQGQPYKAAAGAAPTAVVVSARLLSCLWPPGAVRTDAETYKQAPGAAAPTAPLATLQVECTFGRTAGLPPVVAVRGMPLAQCAVGVSLQLPYLLRLTAPPPVDDPGALLDVVAAAPLGALGGVRAAAARLGLPLEQQTCVVEPPPDETESGWVARRCPAGQPPRSCLRCCAGHRRGSDPLHAVLLAKARCGRPHTLGFPCTLIVSPQLAGG